MPGRDERRDVRQAICPLNQCVPTHIVQILMAVSRKLHLSPSVNLDKLADQTEGYSGADIQAVMYNAQLEVVHESIAKVPASDKLSTRDDEVPVEFVVLRDRKKGQNTSLSRAEQTALQKRVRTDYCNWDLNYPQLLFPASPDH